MLTRLVIFWAQETGAAGEAAVKAAEETGAQQPVGPLGGMFVPIALMCVVFWFLILRPESKKRKAREAMVAAVKKGDSVITTGGMRGVVKRVDGNDVVVQIDKDKDVKVRFVKAAILEVMPDGAEAPDDHTQREIEQRAQQ